MDSKQMFMTLQKYSKKAITAKHKGKADKEIFTTAVHKMKFCSSEK